MSTKSSTNSNEKHYVSEDHLDVDDPISGQSFYCLSVVNPETVLKKKEEYLFYHYYKTKSEEHLERLKLNIESILKKSEDGKLDVKDLIHLNRNMIKGYGEDTKLFEEFKEKYDDYLFTREQALTEQFSNENGFQTSIRGIKVRGTYDNYQEAEKRAKSLQKMDPTFDVFVGQVGYWVPLLINTNQIENQEHSNQELNTLMKSYKENEDNKNVFYEERKQKMKETAMADVKKKQEELKKEEEAKSATTALEEAKVEEVNDNATDNVKHELDEASVQEVLNNNNQVNETIDQLQTEDPWMQRKLNNE